MSFGVHFRIRMNIDFGRAWQHRFCDHAIRNQDDLNNHLDYIHYNPVKHGYTLNPLDWEYYSIHGYFKDGYYSDDWGQTRYCILREIWRIELSGAHGS